MGWFLYDRDLRYERVKASYLGLEWWYNNLEKSNTNTSIFQYAYIFFEFNHSQYHN